MRRGITIKKRFKEITRSFGRREAVPEDKHSSKDILSQINSLRPLVAGPQKPGHGVIKPIAKS